MVANTLLLAKNSIDELVQTVESKYISSVREIFPKMKDIYVEELNKRILEFFSKEEYIHAQYILGIFQKALNSAKENNLNRAELDIIKGTHLISGINDESLKKLIETIIYPQLTYYYYKKKEYQSALKMTFDAIQKFEDLELKYPFFHVGKLQQVHNVCRIYLRENNVKEYINWTLQALIYLLYGKAPAIGKNWGNEFIEKGSQELREAMFAQIFNETIYNYLLILNDNERILIDNGLSDILNSFQFSSLASRCMEYHLWNQVRAEGINSEIPYKIQLVIKYFNQSVKVIPVLEFHLLKELLMCLESDKDYGMEQYKKLRLMIENKYSSLSFLLNRN